MGPRRKHQHRLEALENRLFLSARSDDAQIQGHDVDFDSDAPFEVAAHEHGRSTDSGIHGAQESDDRDNRSSTDPISVPKSLAAALFAQNGRDGKQSASDGPGAKEHKDPPGRALGHAKHGGTDLRNDTDSPSQVIIGSSGDGRGSRPVDPYIETGSGTSDPPMPGYKPPDREPADSNNETPPRSTPFIDPEKLVPFISGSTWSKQSDPTIGSKSTSNNSESGQPLGQGPTGNFAAREESAGVTSASPPPRTGIEIVVPENIEPATTTEEANTTTAPETETAVEEAGSQPVMPAGDTVSAQPLGAAGAPVEKLSQEMQGDESHPIKPVAEAEAVDVTSAAVAAFWAAVEILPVMPIAASQAGFNDELAEAVRVNFESFTEAVDTLLDTLAAQFDLSGPGRTRDLIFASSAALLAALACEKVRRRQQRLDDENLASMGFDADGYLSLAEGL